MRSFLYPELPRIFHFVKPHVCQMDHSFALFTVLGVDCNAKIQRERHLEVQVRHGSFVSRPQTSAQSRTLHSVALGEQNRKLISTNAKGKVRSPYGF
jgi:purine nucleoside phosphorylase